MSKSAYARFLASPSAALLTEDAALLYITTLTTIHEPAKIIKNLASKELIRKEQKILTAIEDASNNTLAAEVETTLEFLTSGGAYLPGLDDNFLADRIVSLPIVHFVRFDQDGRIRQIRLHWDQASLLKHIEVIGARGKNWPISDGIDQTRLIASCDEAAAKASNPQTSSAPAAKKNAGEVTITSRAPRANGNNSNVTRDPHASLSLFGPRDNDNDNSYEKANAPRASARPPPRDYHDLFVGGDSDRSTDVTPHKKHFQESKHVVDRANAPKAGGGKSYQPSRLFNEEEDDSKTPPTSKTGGLMTNSKKYNHFDLSEGGDAPEPSPYKVNSKKYNHFDLGEGGDAPEPSPYKVSPKKYNHFEFADGSDPADAPKAQETSQDGAKTSKHASQWDFEDFTTLAKPAGKVRGQDVRHINLGNSDDEDPQESPIKAKRIPQARPDAKTHFEFKDDGTPEGERRRAGQARGTAHNNGLGLYSNNLYDEDGKAPPEEPEKRPLTSVTTNVNAHRKVFDSQFSMNDESPSSKGAKEDARAIPENQKKVVSMMNASWDTYDQSPSGDKKENDRIKTSGDGMGGRRGGGPRAWGIGDDSDGEGEGGVNGPKFQKGIRAKGGRHGQDDHWEF